MTEARPGTFTIPQPREIWNIVKDGSAEESDLKTWEMGTSRVIRFRPESVYLAKDVQALVDDREMYRVQKKIWYNRCREVEDQLVIDNKRAEKAEAELAAATARIAELENRLCAEWMERGFSRDRIVEKLDEIGQQPPAEQAEKEKP